MSSYRMHRKRLFFFFVIMSLLSSPLFSQGELGNWLMYFGSNRISEKVSIHTEIQYRLHTALPTDIEQLLLRAGVNYHINSSTMVSGGYGYVTSYDFDGDYKTADSKEHRIWQQLILSQFVGRLKFEHRYRVEQRWVNDNYRNRLRYRIMTFLPLSNPTIEPGTLFLGLYDEIFMNTKSTFFDRNRLYGAFGYQISSQTSVQLGMLHQQVGANGKWYLQMALSFNPDLRKN